MFSEPSRCVLYCLSSHRNMFTFNIRLASEAADSLWVLLLWIFFACIFFKHTFLFFSLFYQIFTKPTRLTVNVQQLCLIIHVRVVSLLFLQLIHFNCDNHRVFIQKTATRTIWKVSRIAYKRNKNRTSQLIIPCVRSCGNKKGGNSKEMSLPPRFFNGTANQKGPHLKDKVDWS